MTKGKKHMDGTKRCRIQFGLEAGESARTIAKQIGDILTTVTREIAKHTYDDVAFNLPIVAFTLSGDLQNSETSTGAPFGSNISSSARSAGANTDPRPSHSSFRRSGTS